MGLSLLNFVVVCAALATEVTTSTAVCPKVVFSWEAWFHCVFDSFYSHDFCDTDYPCKQGFVCCQTVCVSKCHPVQGQCPPPSGKIGTCDFNRARGDCLKDTECAKGQLCCPEGCGKRCKDPVVPENGVCPKVNTDIQCITYIDQCGAEKKCEAGKLCCPGPCGRECYKPVIVRPGTCPVPPNPALVRCATKDKCSTDTDCSNPKKCCPHPCGRYCSDPL